MARRGWLREWARVLLSILTKIREVYMSNPWGRLGSTILAASAAFVACWAILQFVAGVDTTVGLGWAIVPFTIMLTIGGLWADQARKAAKQGEPSTGRSAPRIKRTRVVQRQWAGDNARQLQVGRDVRANKKDA
jgi:hypothetical protein